MGGHRVNVLAPLAIEQAKRALQGLRGKVNVIGKGHRSWGGRIVHGLSIVDRLLMFAQSSTGLKWTRT